MKETVENCLRALERIELELQGCTNPTIKDDIEYIRLLISTGEEFGEKKAYVAKKVQQMLFDHNIEISDFYVKFIEIYKKISVCDLYYMDTMIKKIIEEIDEINVKENGSKPFTVAMFARMSKEYKGILKMASIKIIFLSDLEKYNIEDFKKIRNCGDKKAEMLMEYLKSEQR